jgi:uncharacterized RDD family membrane protein YckC
MKLTAFEICAQITLDRTHHPLEASSLGAPAPSKRPAYRLRGVPPSFMSSLTIEGRGLEQRFFSSSAARAATIIRVKQLKKITDETMTEQEASPPAPPGEKPALPPHPESLSHLASDPAETAPVIRGSIADPWLRFFARFVDIQIEIFVLYIVAGLLVPALFQSRLFLSGQLGSKLIGVIFVPFALALDAVAYSVFSNTPGKWIAGIKVKSVAGDKVSFQTYLKRNFGLYWFGLGLDIPIVVLVTLWRSYGQAAGDEIVRWDKNTGTRAFMTVASTLRLVAIGAIWLLFYGWQAVQMMRARIA